MSVIAQNDASGIIDSERVRSATVAELRSELADAIRLTARSLLRAAILWAELERRGEDLSDLRSGIGTYLPLIATGAVSPEAVVAFAGQPTLLRHVTSLPIGEQIRLAAGESVPVVERSGDRYTHRMLPVRALTARLAKQVFGERSVRTEEEQIAVLSSTTAPRIETKSRPKKHGKLRADPKRGVVMIGRQAVNPADLLAALADLTSPDAGDGETAENSVMVKLTDEEHRRLRVVAANADSSMSSLARNAMRATGLI